MSAITLITGDRVHVTEVGDDGKWAIDVDSADREEYEPSFEIEEHGDDVYVVPSDAAPLIPETLDRELFNIRKLVDIAPYTEDGTTETIVTYSDGSRMRSMASTTGVRTTDALSSIDGTAVTVNSEQFWRAAMGDAGTVGAADADAFTGIQKVWLDEPVRVTLDDSVDQVRAPDAWNAGYDGEGATVAVLDTGIDESHVDVGDKVVTAKNFTDDETADDLYGHGTHVASIVAGTGEASGGDRAGVAPGASLVSGKVLDQTGSGTASGIIAGMEWAVERNVDVVNMSLGGGATDGTDPLSQAVNNLSVEYGVSFVVSAGNSGPGEGSITTPGSADMAITVGAVDDDGELASFSSRGPRVGDYAVKPDVTAPGVDIVAARADGTDMGEPVDDDYTQASGTSMAAPHVSGAAAILAQRHDDLAPSTVKSAVTSTAAVHDALSVYEQGGGELDVFAAVEADVLATPAPVDLGFHEYPHDDTDPVTEAVTFTNHGAEDVELDLSLTLTDDDATPPADGMVTVEPSSVAVSAGDSVDVDLTLDLSLGEPGLYGGWLTAAQNGTTVATVPVGFYKEAEMVDLTIIGTMRDGRTARRASSVDVMNVEDRDEFFGSAGFTDGVANVRVPPGTYSVMGWITTLDEDDAFFLERVLIGEPELTITDDTELVFDAREANPVVIDTMHDETVRTDSTLGYHRESETGIGYTHSWVGDSPVFAASTEAVTRGHFEMYTEHTVIAPPLITRATEPVELEVDCEYMIDSPELEAGEYEWDLVPAGLGYPEDFADVDVEGAMALIERGEFTFAQKAKNAYEAGAEAAIIYNDEPGDFNGTLAGEGIIPTFQLSGTEGNELLDLTETGDVRFEVVATPQSPFQYDLVLPEPKAIPSDLRYVIDEDDVATVPTAYYSDRPDHEINISHANWRPYQWFTVTFTDRADAPQERTEYVSANDTRWRKTVYMEPPFDGGLSEPLTYYEPGETRETSWHEQIASPGLIEGTDTHRYLPVRDGDSLNLTIPEWSDAQVGLQRHWGWREFGVDETAFRLLVDGDLVTEADRAVGSFDVTGDPRVRLELNVVRDADWWETSTETATAWEFDSAPTDEPVVLPLLFVDYDLDLTLQNHIPRPRDGREPPAVDFHVRHPRGVDGADIDELRVWTSYDDGATWRERPVLQQDHDRFRTLIDNRDPADVPSDFLSLRVEAKDADGNGLEQEIVHAAALTPRD